MAPRNSAAEAQRILDELVFTGEATLSNGRQLAPDAEQLIGVLKWSAARGKAKIHSVPLPEDFGDTPES